MRPVTLKTTETWTSETPTNFPYFYRDRRYEINRLLITEKEMFPLPKVENIDAALAVALQLTEAADEAQARLVAIVAAYARTHARRSPHGRIGE